MLSIPTTSPRATVFTASFTGIYTFIVATPGGEDFRINGTGFVPAYDAAPGQRAFTVVLQSGDTLDYLGPAVNLYGVRLGDEL